MARIATLRHGVFIALVASTIYGLPTDSWSATAQPASRQNPGGIAWFQDLYEAHQVSISTGRPMMIVFGAEWCHYCKELENTTLRNPRLVSYISANFIPVHIDADRDKRLVEILVKSRQFPCTVILSPDAELLGRVFGFLEVQQYVNELEASRQRYAKMLQRHR